tara:strand:+ start:19332 stop:21695 length:2364 start_codon:yes stop_codon:yes gene_type:complete
MNKTEEITVSIFKDLFKSTDVPYIVTLKNSLDRIKIGKSKDVVNAIRLSDDKDERTNLKKRLPCILFAGEFVERKKSGLQKHSGLMVVDFDKFPGDKEMKKQFKALTSNKHFVSVFVSPSGNGLKGVIKIPKCEPKDHEQYFKEFQKTFNFDYFDISNCNVDRVCFESYDPNIYINYDAEIFEPQLKNEGYNVHEKVPLILLSDESKIIDLIMSWNWSKDFVDGQRNNYILDLAGAFCEYGINESTAYNYIFNNIVIGDFTENETRTTISSAYRIRSFGTKYFEDYTKLGNIKKDLKYGKDVVIKKHAITEQVFEEIKEENEQIDFWYFGKEDTVKINVLKYKLFLEGNGFKKYFPADAQKPTWVKIKSNIVNETSVEKIKDFVLNYLMDRKEIQVWSYVASFPNLFAENYLLMLDTIELMMLKDLKNKSFIAYQNGILEVTSQGANLIDYLDVDGYIWKDQIINRDFMPMDDNSNDYKQFINNISGGNPLPIECAIGYMLCTYKNKTKNKALILNDEIISDNPEGGTGKGLLVQGLANIRRVSVLDGKSFDDKKSFPYQTVSQATQILVFDDVKKNFDFETKFSLVTEGITLERKNKDAIKLTVEESPKLCISTNYAIKGEGNSHDRRRHELEISQFYNKDYSPFDEFDTELFDWSILEFQKFDNYMVECLQSFLKLGLIKQHAKNIKLRKFIAESSMEFYEWASEDDNLSFDVRHNQKVIFNKFTDDYPDFKRWLTQKKFNAWISKWGTLNGVKFTKGHSQNERWIELISKEDMDEFNVTNKEPF